MAHGGQGQADAGGADKASVVVIHAVVDEDRHAVAVGHVDIDIGFIVAAGHVAHAVVPDVALGFRTDRFERAFGVIIFAGLVGNQEAGDGAVFLFHFGQVTHDLPAVVFAGQYPVTHKGVVRHQRRDEDRAQHVFLDLGIDIVTRQRQGLVGDAVFDGLARRQVTGQAGGNEAGRQDQGQEKEQTVFVRQETHESSERSGWRAQGESMQQPLSWCNVNRRSGKEEQSISGQITTTYQIKARGCRQRC